MLKNVIGTLCRVEKLAATRFINDRHYHRWVYPTLVALKVRQKKERMKSFSKPRKIYPRSGFLDWNLDAELYAFGKRLGEDFDPDLLKTAFTFRSYVIKEESRQKDVGVDVSDIQKDNLELIEEGESFMLRYIPSYLELAFPDFPQEGISAIKDFLTTESILSNVSRSLGTKDIILSDEYPISNATFAKTFKAIVGALLQSSGDEQAAHFVRDFVIVKLNGEDVNELWKIDNPLEMLTSILEKSGKKPEPRLIQGIGKNSLLACYKVGIYVDKQMFSAGYGEGLEIAKEMAAREGLKIIFGTQDNMPPIDFKIQGIPNKKEIKTSVKKQLSM